MTKIAKREKEGKREKGLEKVQRTKKEWKSNDKF